MLIQKESVEAIRLLRKEQLKSRLNALPTHSDSFRKVYLVGSALLIGVLSTTWLAYWKYSNKEFSEPIALEESNASQVKEEFMMQLPILTEPYQNVVSKEDSQKDTDRETSLKTTQSLKLRVIPKKSTHQFENNQKNSKAFGLSNIKKVKVQSLNAQNVLPLVNASQMPEMKKLRELLDKENVVKIDNIKFAKKAKISKAYLNALNDMDKGIYEGKNQLSLEAIAAQKVLMYQYYNNELFLFNNTAIGKELSYVEDGVKRCYLYYQNNYYELQDNQIEPTTPKSVDDEVLIQKLDAFRTKIYH
jgi:hypothetical protein